MENNNEFWECLEKIVYSNEIIIDRPKGSRHPKYNDMVYEVDYGYLKNIKSMDGGGIDIFVGTDGNKNIDTIICIIDLLKNDSEIKILKNCTEEETLKIYNFLNNSDYMKAIIIRKEVIRRGLSIPSPCLSGACTAKYWFDRLPVNPHNFG
jgi:inorganic pyrophosphatase